MNKEKPSVLDVRPVKASLREESKRVRAAMPSGQKQLADNAIAERFFSLPAYKSSEVLLTYVSTDIEVDTRFIIDRALRDGKRVAAPRCVKGTRNMEFYLISSRDELQRGAFGVLEPLPEKSRRLTELSEGLCVVPALLFDLDGYRIGYGGGYYDRFLARFGGVTVGICYASCIKRSLVRGKYDRPVDILITEKFQKVTDSRRPCGM